MSLYKYILVSMYAALVILPNIAVSQGSTTLTINSILPNEPIGDYIARDKIIALPGSNFIANGSAISHLYLDKNIVAPIDVNGNPYSDYSINSVYTIDKNLPVGYVNGEFNVNNGQANYNIPISLAPGTANFIPKVSINYNSSQTDGIVGVGWGISGISSITRIPRDYYHLGEFEYIGVAPIAFNGIDLLTLDGNRIGNTYGTGLPSNVYRLENDNFTEVKYISSTNSFEVTTKEGIVMEYGNTYDSKLTVNKPVNNTTAVLTYYLNKVTDKNGNYYVYEYLNLNGEVAIKEIKYTGNANAGITPYNSVKFYYDSREDKNIAYFKGNALSTALILREVELFCEGVSFKKIVPTYQKINDKTFLESITEYGADHTKLNPTKFAYDNGNPSGNSGISVGILGLPTLPSLADYSVGDFNGDGKADVIAYKYSNPINGDGSKNYTGWELYLNQNNGQNYTLAASNTPGTSFIPYSYYGLLSEFNTEAQGRLTGDLNGDGKEDMILITDVQTINTTYTPYYSNFTGNTGSFIAGTQFSLPASTPGQVTQVRLADIDGDKIPEIIAYGTFTQDGTKSIFIHDFLTSTTQVTLNDPASNAALGGSPFNIVQIIDFDEDGTKELLVQNSLKTSVVKINGYDKTVDINASFTLSKLAEDDGILSTGTRNFYGDFNGDGLTDKINQGITVNQMTLKYGTGAQNSATNSFYSAPVSVANIVPGQDTKAKILIADMDNDGKSDIIRLNTASNGISMTIAYGKNISNSIFIGYDAGFQTQFPEGVDILVPPTTFISNGNDVQEFCLGDFDGNGYTDVMFKMTTSTQHLGERAIIYNYPTNTNGKLKRITNGFASEISINYSTLSNSSLYTKGSGATYPLMDVYYPLTVVSVVGLRDANDNVYGISYKYDHAKYHLTGKGFLGFEKTTIVNTLNQTQTTLVSSLNNVANQPPLLLPTSSKTYLLSNLNQPIKETYNNYTYVTSFPSVPLVNQKYNYYVLLDETDEIDNSNGVTKITNYSYDNYHNQTEILSDINSGYQISKKTITIDPNLYGNKYPSYTKSILSEETRTGKTTIAFETQFAYESNNSGLVNKITNYYSKSCANTLEYTHEANTGLVLNSTINNLRTTSVEYDSKFRFVTKTTNPLGHYTTTLYNNNFGVPLKTTDITNLTTEYTYDGFGKNIAIKTPDNNISTTNFKWYETSDDISGDPFTSAIPPLIVVKKASPNSPTISNFLNAHGLSVKKSKEGYNQNYVSNLTTYNDMGQVLTSTANYLIPCADPSSILVTTNTYADPLYRLTSSVISDGNTNLTSTIAYSQSNGNISSVYTDFSGKTKTVVTDPVGLTISVTDNLQNIITYDYNSRGKEIETKLAGNTVKTKSYDDCLNLFTINEPHNGTTYFTYDNFGQILTRSNNGHTYTFNYDVIGRASTISSPEGTYTNNYKVSGNGKGLIEQEIAPGGAVCNYSYDNLNRLIKKEEIINGQTFATQMTYDQYSNVIQQIYPSGFKVKSVYNNLGYLSQIIDETHNTPIWQGDEMNALNDYNKFTLGNSKQSLRTYDNFGHVINEQAGNIFDFSYDFNAANGNLNYWQDNIKQLKETFTYDGMDRLINSTVGNLTGPSATIPPLNLTYDPNGNITNKSDVSSFKYDPAKKTQAVAVHDELNHLISHTTQDISYTSFNQPQNITEGTDGAVFTYGSDFNRVQVSYATASGTKIRYYLDGYEKETDGATTRDIHYIRTPSGLTAIHVIENGTPHTYFTYNDHLGTPKTITDESGVIVAEQNFDPWGQHRNPTTWDYTAVPNPPAWLYRGYTGHEHLPQFSLVNMNGRLYDPQNARMLSADPVLQDPSFTQDYNKYTYAYNNPLKYTDPTGYWDGWDDVIAMVVGGTANVINNVDHIKGRGDGWDQFGLGVEYFLAGAVGAEISLYAGPIVGAAIGGAANVAVDNVNHNFDNPEENYTPLQSFTRGALSSLTGAEAGAEAGNLLETKGIEVGYKSNFTELLNSDMSRTPLFRASYQGMKKVAAGYADKRYDDSRSILGSVLTNFAIGFGGEYLGNYFDEHFFSDNSSKKLINEEVIKNMKPLKYGMYKSGIALAVASAGSFTSTFTENIYATNGNGNYFKAFADSFYDLQPWTNKKGQNDLLSDGGLILMLSIIKSFKK